GRRGEGGGGDGGQVGRERADGAPVRNVRSLDVWTSPQRSDSTTAGPRSATWRARRCLWWGRRHFDGARWTATTRPLGDPTHPYTPDAAPSQSARHWVPATELSCILGPPCGDQIRGACRG